MKKATKLILYLLIITFLIMLVQRTQLPGSWNELFSDQPILVENTPMLIKEIRNMAELITVTAHDEVVIDSSNASSEPINRIAQAPVNPLSPATDRIVLIARGAVKAGIDLRLVVDSDIYVEGDSVAIKLPPAEILEVIINPSGFTTFLEIGEWSPEAVQQVKMNARRMFELRAFERNILGMAERRSRVILDNFLRTAGFNRITIL